MIDQICYDIPSVFEARFARDVANAVYRANPESIKLQLRMLDVQVRREWGGNHYD